MRICEIGMERRSRLRLVQYRCMEMRVPFCHGRKKGISSCTQLVDYKKNALLICFAYHIMSSRAQFIRSSFLHLPIGRRGNQIFCPFWLWALTFRSICHSFLACLLGTCSFMYSTLKKMSSIHVGPQHSYLKINRYYK